MHKKILKTRLRRFCGPVLCAVVMISGAVRLAAQDNILANGNPPLTSVMVDRYVRLMEWALDVQFDRQDRAAVQKQLVAYWQTADERNTKGVLDTLAFEQNLNNAAAAKRQELQPQIKQKLLDTMNAETSDPMNALLLDVYRKNQDANNAAPASDGAGLDQLVGKWRVLHGNSVVSVDMTSGRIGDGNAMIAQYDIKPDGRVIFSFVLQQSNFGCTTKIKTSKTGRVSVSGSRLAFTYDAGGSMASEDNCNRTNNYTKRLAAETETFDFHLKRDENGKAQMCFASAKLKDCAVKVE